MKHYQLIVIGGGPAGLAAAHAAWEAGLRSVLVIERDKSLGGILNQCIHNGFGLHRFKEELTGPEYAGRFIELLAATGVEVKTDTMVLQLTPEREVFVSSAAGVEALSADTIVLAMGCRERARGAVGIPGARPAGVFTAGTAQMYMNLLGLSVGRRVVIRGTGDIGLIMARRMTLEGAKVLACIGAGDRPDGLARNVQQCLTDFDIPLLLRHTVTDVRGTHRVEQVVAAEVDAQRRVIPGTEKTFDCDTLLLSIGLIPENELARQAGIPLGRTGGAVVYENNETCVPGIFACGNALQVHDLVDFVTEESVRAGRAAAARVLEGPVPEGAVLEIRPGDGVNYTVPGYARKANLGRGIELSFRVKGHYGDAAAVTVRQGGEADRALPPPVYDEQRNGEAAAAGEARGNARPGGRPDHRLRRRGKGGGKMTELTCIVCPRGCHLTVDEANDYAVRGNACPRGAEYGRTELCAPTRTLTTTVRLTGGALPRVPVRTAAPIPKARLAEAMAAINAVTAAAPVHIGDVLLPDLLGTGVAVIATRNMEKA